MNDSSTGEEPGSAEQMAFVRDETRFEIGLLHERVNALIGAEAFLTIAFTAAMSTGEPWGAVVSPILSVLGLLLALLAWPGIRATVEIVLRWTARRDELLDRNPGLAFTVWGLSVVGGGNRSAESGQRRGLLFFRVAPGLFAVAWAAMTVVAFVSA